MTAKEKVIAGLKCCLEPGAPCQKCPYYTEGCTMALKRDTLGLLEEQEPIKPYLTMDENNAKCWCCRSCDAVLVYAVDDRPWERIHYCRNCGKPLKWEMKKCTF